MILPIATTTIDWNTYLTAAKRLSGKSVTGQLDGHHIKPDSLKAYLITLGNLIDPTLRPDEILKNPGGLLKHASCSFLTVLDSFTLLELLQQSKLSVLSVEKITIVSGTLAEWRESIIDGCSITSSQPLREFLDACLLDFEKIGLGQLWYNYRKTSNHDQTFILEDKS